MNWLKALLSGASPNTVAQHRAMLASWRKLLAVCHNLQLSLHQAHLPTEVASGIIEARAEIERLKKLLRGWGDDVLDLPDELTTANPEEIAHHLKLLEIHRRNLAQYLRQQHDFGERGAPPVVANGIADTRRDIKQIKQRLRTWSAPVADLPDDEEVQHG